MLLLKISREAKRPANKPIEALSTYPSTPVICPANRMFDLGLNRSWLSSKVGEFINEFL